MSSSEINVPEGMRCLRRLPHQDFEPHEFLYLRFNPAHIKNEFLPDTLFPLPAFSVNRQGHNGEPYFVLIPRWRDWRIARSRVDSVPANIAPNVSFNVVHDPVCVDHPDYALTNFENYHHSEIRSFVNGESQKPSAIIRKAYRDHLRKAFGLMPPPYFPDPS